MSIQNFKGLWVPKELYCLKNLGWTEILMLAEIETLDRQGQCYANNEHFSELFKITKESASRVINKLVRLGYLISKIEYKQGTKQVIKRILKLNWNFILADENNESPNGINEDTTSPQSEALPPCSSDVDPSAETINKDTILRIQDRYNIYAQNRPEPENEINSKSFNCSELFERFYKIYPKKKGKHKAYKWFKTHKPNAELVGRMIEAVKLQMRTFAWRKSGGAFIPYPTSWLNSGGWENEVSPEEIADTSETSVSRFLAIELYEKLKAKRFESTKENEKLINSWALEIESYLSVCRVKEREDRVFYAINQIGASDKWRHSIIDAQSLIHNIDFIGK